MAYTDEEIEKMRMALAEHDLALAKEEATTRVQFMQPIRDFVTGGTFTTFESELSALQPIYAADNSVNVHINAIIMILGNLKQAAEFFIPAPVSIEPPVDLPINPPGMETIIEPITAPIIEPVNTDNTKTK